MTYTIAHRGLAAEGRRENSLAAFAAALDHVQVLEVDVRCTHDGVPICVHDANLERSHGLDVRVGHLDLAAVRAAAPDVSTLEEVLDLAADRDAGVMLDVKVSRPRAIEAIESAVDRSRVTWNDGRQVRRGEPLDARTATFQSADSQLLQALRSRTGAGCVELVRGSSGVRELMLGAPFITAYAQGVTIPDLLATRGMLRMLRGLRLGAYVYTVNDQARFDALVEGGASGVYTDRADVIG
jgi:glycerophosphoryl diester phosphodiesterase